MSASDSDEEGASLRKQLQEKFEVLSALKDRIAAQAKEIAREKLDLAEQLKGEAQGLIADKLRDFAERRLDAGLDDLKVTAAGATKDPYMPLRVQKAVDDIYDAVWDDVKEEVRNAVMSLVTRSPMPRHATEPPECCCLCCGKLQAKIRYFLYPFDKSFWRQMRSPLYFVWFLVSLVPVYGVPQAVYLMELIVIDRGDEYQLVRFILSFKATLFITLGLIGSAVAAVTFYVCLQDLDGNSDDVGEQCSSAAPQEPIYLMALFVVQVLMVWFAFFKIPASQKKGGDLYRQQLEEAQDAAEDKEKPAVVARLRQSRRSRREARHRSREEREKAVRGRLNGWLYYELFLFCVCMTALLVAMFAGPNSSSHKVTDDAGNWRLMTTMFMVKCFYGLASMPFIALQLPVVATLLTHARATGYTPMGECVPYRPEQPMDEAGDGTWAKPARPMPSGA